MSEKMWGGEPFWGLGYEWDPDWVLTDRQKELRATLIELCEKEMRANAKRSDDELLFPRRNLELLGEHGFLALTVPEEYGGLGENHVAYAMTCETIARYGCASTAMCYVMHIGAVNAIMLRPTDGADRALHPAAATAGRSARSRTRTPRPARTSGTRSRPAPSASNGGFKVRKKASWTTSAGFADFYVVQTTSPDFSGYDDLSVFVIDGEEAQAQPSLWDALGLRGNQSGPLEVPDVEIPGEQIVGPVGDGAASNDESVDPWFLIGSSSVWNGIALGTIDIAKRHTTRKRHVDVGLRVADYPTIQDYVGEALMDTNASRLFVYSVAQAMDNATDDNTKVLAVGELARADFLHWAWQIKFEAAKNVAHVVDKMLHACGGSGYKRDMELERYLRDAKAGWVMGPTNEVLRQFVGKAVLLGFDALDYWNQSYNRRAVENEVKKLDADGKRELAEQLMAQAAEEEAKAPAPAPDVTVSGTPALVRGLLPEDPFLETYLVRPGGATVFALAPDERVTVVDTRRRPGAPRSRARRRRARRRGRARRERPTRRRRSFARRSPTGTGAFSAHELACARARPGRGHGDPALRRVVAPGLVAGLPRRARRDGRRRRAGRADRRRRAASVRAPRRGPAHAAPRRTSSRSCRRRSPSRGSTSASTPPPRSRTRCARASSSR